MRQNKTALLNRLFGAENERLPQVRSILLELVQQAVEGLTAEDVNRFRDALHGVGPSLISEILALRFPDKYWIWNGPVKTFMRAQGAGVKAIKAELPYGKKTDEGEIYMAAGEHIEDLRRELSEAAGQEVDYLFADLFI